MGIGIRKSSVHIQNDFVQRGMLQVWSFLFIVDYIYLLTFVYLWWKTDGTQCLQYIFYMYIYIVLVYDVPEYYEYNVYFTFFSSLKGQSAIQTKATKRLPSQCFCELKQIICTVYGRQLDLFLYTASDIFILV